jgi:hypothetical protein
MRVACTGGPANLVCRRGRRLDRRQPVTAGRLPWRAGPGHDYLTTLVDLAGTGRRRVFSDQFGRGRSGHRSDVPVRFGSIALVIDQVGEYRLTGVDSYRFQVAVKTSTEFWPPKPNEVLTATSR